MKPEIVITARGHAGTMATLQAEFTSHLLSEASDRTGFLKQHAPAVRALATFGPMAVDGKLMDADALRKAAGFSGRPRSRRNYVKFNTSPGIPKYSAPPSHRPLEGAEPGPDICTEPPQAEWRGRRE
jgi:hypothetical protein